MATVLNRLTGELVLNAHIPDYVPDQNNNDTPWIIEPDLSNVYGIDPKFWVIGEDGSTTVRQMSQHEMDINPAFLAQAQQDAINAINAICAAGIVGGVISSALGYPRLYDTTPEDQLNILGAILATSPNPMYPSGISIPYACRDPVTLAKAFIVHTYAQLMHVLADGAVIKLEQLVKANELKAMIKAATSVTQVNQIHWP